MKEYGLASIFEDPYQFICEDPYTFFGVQQDKPRTPAVRQAHPRMSRTATPCQYIRRPSAPEPREDEE